MVQQSGDFFMIHRRPRAIAGNDHGGLVGLRACNDLRQVPFCFAAAAASDLQRV
jgi:hypothetical protein